MTGLGYIAGLVVVCSIVWGGELAERHQALPLEERRFSPNSRTDSHIEVARHGITEIGLERTTCKGVCPAYTVVLKSDGSVRYVGRSNALKRGEHTGRIPKAQFDRLAEFINEVGYMELDSTYSRTVMGGPTAFTSVVRDDGQTKTISEYDRSGPASLWAVEQLIDHLTRTAVWDEPRN